MSSLALWLCDRMIDAGRLVRARELADHALRGDEWLRDHARMRLGALATLEGHFGAARESLEPGLAAWPLHWESVDYTPTFHALRGIAEVSGDRALLRRTLLEEMAHDAWSQPERLPELRYELAIVDGGQACPAVDAFLTGMKPGPARAAARARVRKVGAAYGCVPCAEIVGESELRSDSSPIGAFRYAACAIATGHGDAIDPLFSPMEQQIRLAYAAPVHALKLHLLRARDLERRGRLSEARAHDAEVVAHWGAADRTLPEVNEARAGLERLGPPAALRSP
jgi:hypothetical protein